MGFVHLHVHSEYSLLDGLAKIPDLIGRAKELKMDSLAITDHGTMSGVVKFYTAAKEAGIKPIIGIESYLAGRSRFDKEAGVDKDYHHQLLLAKNDHGYKNLMKLSTLAHLEGYYYKPRIDKEILSLYHDGVIATSSCLQGIVPQLILHKDLDAARREVRWYLQVFGDDYYLELQRHRNIPELDAVNEQLVALSREFGIPLLATNDVHYVDATDAQAQDALLAVQTKKFLADKDRLTMIDSPDFYLKSAKEMETLYQDYPEAVSNSVKIADACSVTIPIGHWILPRYPINPGETPESTLMSMTFLGLEKRFDPVTDEMKTRTQYELDVICKKGFATYFLIVQDFVNWAKKEGIRVGPGRGSVAGSLVAYALRITSINPLEHNIPFERFMNPDRPTPPDIDLDFADDRRDEVIAYVTRKYGQDKVAQIITFGTMEARQAIRDIGRVMGLPYSIPDRLAKMIPPKFSIDQALNSIIELEEEAKDPTVKQLLLLAQKVEGVARHASTHAAGVVIADKPLTEYTPLQLETKADRVMTQYDMYSLDLNVSDRAIGLLKIDLLGLRNLTILGRAIELVKERRGISVDLSDLPLNDTAVYDLISQGETTGVFQLESHGMRRLARNLRPNKFSDLTAMVALYRPGPMELIDDFIQGKKHPDRVLYLHPDLKPILAPTYGVAVYQEQCMQIANKVAGYTMAEADNLRRAIGKKKKSIMAIERKKFISGAVKNGYSKTNALKIWGFIERFVGYGFNIPHSVCYAMIAYQTAYLKVKYPAEYMTALLTSESRGTSGPIRDRNVARGIDECRRIGIRVLSPEINASNQDFSLEESPQSTEGLAIRIGLSAVKNIGDAAISEILDARSQGVFTSLTDFLTRVDTQKANKKVIESLVRVGAFDQFPGTRAGKLAALDELRSKTAASQKRKQDGQGSLFDGLDDTEATATPGSADNVPDLPELSRDDLLKYEKELLGVYLTEHPLQQFLDLVQDRISCQIGDISVEDHDGKDVVVAGVCTQLRSVQTRRSNESMCFATIEDRSGSIEIVVFPQLYKRHQADLATEIPLLIQGKVDFRNDRLGIVASQLASLRDPDLITIAASFAPLGSENWHRIEIPRGTSRDVLTRISKLLKSSRGSDRVQIVLQNGNGSVKTMNLPYTVHWSDLEDTVRDLIKS